VVRYPALRRKSTPRSQVAETQTFVAPTRGWFVAAPMADAPEGTAFLLENAFPELFYVRARGGAMEWATGMASNVRALCPWNSGASNKTFAVTSDGKIYDATSQGAVGAAAVTGLSIAADAVPSFMQFNGSGTEYLFIANGYDPLQSYNGIAWNTAPAITGLTGNQLSYIWPFKGRIYGIERQSLRVWYLGLAAVGGAATLLDLSTIFKLGGNLVAGGTWQMPTERGLYATNVFLSDLGEVAVYTGGFPGAADWEIQGVYKIGPPVGQNCLLQTGADLTIATHDGIVPLSKAITLDRIALQNEAATQPIQPEWIKAVLERLMLREWQLILWPVRDMMIVNLPHKNTSDRTQFVVHARSGAWARYTGWDASCFGLGGPNQTVMYYGTSDGRTMVAEAGGHDAGAFYQVTIWPSYSNLGSGAVRKKATFVRPRMQSAFPITIGVTTKVDFNTELPIPPAVSSGVPAGGWIWGIGVWGSLVWPDEFSEIQEWIAAPAFGSYLAPVVQILLQTESDVDVRLTATDIQYESGNVIG